MTGIGLQPQEPAKRGGYFPHFRAFLRSAVRSSGPWLTTTAALAALGMYAPLALQAGAPWLLLGTIIHAYAFSLILAGAWQNPLVRFIADKLSEGHPEEILPGIRTAGVGVFGLSLAVVGPATCFARFDAPVHDPLLFRLATVLLFAILGELWIGMSCLGSSRTRLLVFLPFLAGSAISLVLSILAIRRGLVSSALLGYVAGQALSVALLSYLGEREFRGRGWWHRGSLARLQRYAPLALAGFFYNAGIWADKIILWITRGTSQGANLLHPYPPYDIPALLAFLSLVPALIWGLSAGEANFLRPYRAFAESLLHEPLVQIQRTGRELREAVRRALSGMAMFQGIFTLACLILAGPLLRAIGFGWVSPRLFRILLLAAFASALLMNTLVLMLYLELCREAARSALWFLAANVTLTLISTRWGEAALGWGYLIAAVLTFAYAWLVLVARLPKLDYYLFTRQIEV